MCDDTKMLNYFQFRVTASFDTKRATPFHFENSVFQKCIFHITWEHIKLVRYKAQACSPAPHRRRVLLIDCTYFYPPFCSHSRDPQKMTTQNLVTSLLRIKQAFMLSTIPLGEYTTIHLFFCHLCCSGLIFPLQTVKYTLTHVHWQTLPCGLLVPVCFPSGTHPETQGTNDLTIQDTVELFSRRIKQLTLPHLEQALADKSTSHLSTINYLSVSIHTRAGHPRFLSSEMSAHFCQLLLSGCLSHNYSSSL